MSVLTVDPNGVIVRGVRTLSVTVSVLGLLLVVAIVVSAVVLACVLSTGKINFNYFIIFKIAKAKRKSKNIYLPANQMALQKVNITISQSDGSIKKNTKKYPSKAKQVRFGTEFFESYRNDIPRMRNQKQRSKNQNKYFQKISKFFENLKIFRIVQNFSKISIFFEKLKIFRKSQNFSQISILILIFFILFLIWDTSVSNSVWSKKRGQKNCVGYSRGSDHNEYVGADFSCCPSCSKTE